MDNSPGETNFLLLLLHLLNLKIASYICLSQSAEVVNQVSHTTNEFPFSFHQFHTVNLKHDISF